ncbi:MAG: CapA family protein [Actinomycetota bacterium]|nr:CapA family protein [Actinomycetota bacterium]
MRWRRIVLLVACFGLAGCTLFGTETADRPPATSASPAPRYDVPIAFVTHLAGDIDDLSAAQARKLLAEGADNWTALGAGSKPLKVVAAEVAEAGNAIPTVPSAQDAISKVDSGTVAIVPANAVTPRVRVLTVDGIDPLREAGDYPLSTTASQRPGAAVVTTVVGDIMLGRRVGASLERGGDPTAVFGPFAERLASADVTVGNLESTLSRAGPPTQGGDSFAANPDVLNGLELAGFDVLSLGNNHLGDFGPRAISDTIDRLVGGGFAIIGGGKDLDQARRASVVERKGIRIGFIATDSIGETPAATSSRAGTNRVNAPPRTGPLDRTALDRVSDDIRRLDAEADIVVVLPHWGTQYTHVPENSQRQMARAFVEAGADVVAGGHPHWVQGWETIGDGTVVHSLGNFIFDMDFMRKTQEGIFIEIVSWGDRVVAIEPVPYVIDGNFAPRPASPDRAESTIGDIRSTSRSPFTELR